MRTIALALAISTLSFAALASDFPQTFEHRYGTTVIERRPENVVSLSFSGHDDLLALGVTPVALRYWYGDFPRGVWPWADDKLGDAEPVVLKGELDIEAIAALQPDVIVGLWSGMTQDQYDILSQIAPTVAAEADYTDYGTPWHVRARTLGRVVGAAEKAEELVSAIEGQMADIAAANPSWQGKTAAVAFHWSDAPGAYSSIDIRPLVLAELGFTTPDAINAAAAEANGYSARFSKEDLSALDTDLLIWIVTGDVDNIRSLALRKSLKAHQEGREVVANDLLSGAFSHATLLSLPYVLEELVPLIEAAIDGDPSTVVSSTKEAGLLD
ncbi:MAG: ABC transporter substrate-binding protein [Pseudomonadota bacterium]